MRDLFGTRLELRLGDPMDSEIDRKIATLVPAGRPGRGLVPGKLHFLGALPRIDGAADAETLGDGVEDLVKRVSAAWTGPTGPKLRLLPERIDLDAVRAQASPAEGETRLLLGINEKELAPVGLDVDSEPHLLIFGDGQSGKSAVLRSYVREVMRTRTPQQAQIVLVDYRRSLLGEVPEDYLLNYLTSATQAQPAISDIASYLHNRIPGPDGPKLRLLPERIDLDTVRTQATPADGDRRLLLGINEKELAPVALDADAEPHLLVFGDGQSGKSAVLRAYVREIMRTRTPQEAQIVIVDYRRSLLGEVPDEYLLNYLTSATQAQPAIRDLASYLENRIPGPDVTPDQLRNRSWWKGAEVFVVVDDYDLVATQQSSPVQALQPLMAQARDVGLHITVARRSGGASRALYEPVLQSMRDLAMPGLLLSGSPDEGPLIGNQKPHPAPAGRGRLISRDRGVEVVQMAWTDPAL